jgi:uncharacterized protein (UPF0261 family)
MLRITQTRTEERKAVVRLEGKLLKPWIAEVRSLFIPTQAGSLPALDLSGLTFVDGPGTDLLRDLLREGVAVVSCSAFVAALLHLNDTQVL